MATIKEYTRKIAEEMHVQGLMNMQYAIENDAYGSFHIIGEAFIIIYYLHAPASQNIGGTHHHGPITILRISFILSLLHWRMY